MTLDTEKHYNNLEDNYAVNNKENEEAAQNTTSTVLQPGAADSHSETPKKTGLSQESVSSIRSHLSASSIKSMLTSPTKVNVTKRNKYGKYQLTIVTEGVNAKTSK